MPTFTKGRAQNWPLRKSKCSHEGGDARTDRPGEPVEVRHSVGIGVDRHDQPTQRRHGHHRGRDRALVAEGEWHHSGHPDPGERHWLTPDSAPG